MFLSDCQACGRRELRGARSIELLVTTDSGVDAVYHCTRCGTANVLHQGIAARPSAAAAAA
jgi:hypothetical protein